MRALVTGANGLIGANLVRELIRDGHDVTGLVRPTADITCVRELPIRLVTGDVLDPDSIAAAMDGCDVVFHTAVNFSYWGHTPEAMTRTAVDGTRNVLESARGVGIGRVVVTSSSVTLGSSDNAEVRDESREAANDATQPAYILAKIAQERAALQIADRLGIELVLACPTMSVGAFGSALGPSNGVIAGYLADPLRLTWEGGCNIVSVRDVARGHILLAERGVASERYVLGSENLAWREVHALIGELAGIPPPGPAASSVACYLLALGQEARARLLGEAPLATRAQARMVGRYYWYSHERAAALGFRPCSARDALADAISWLAASTHVSRETRIGMRLHRIVHAARAARAAEERNLLARAV